MVRGDDRDQHIRIMPDFIRVDMVLVIAGMIPAVVIHLILQRSFLVRIGTLGSPHIRFLSRISADHNGFQHGLYQRAAGLQGTDQEKKHGSQSQNDQNGRMLPDCIYRFARDLAGLLSRLVSGFGCRVNGAFSAFGGSILPADRPLLLPSGIGIAGELRMFLLTLGLQELDVRLIQLLFGFHCLPVVPHVLRVIGMLTGLQGSFPYVVGFQYGIDRRVIIIVGLRDLPVQLISRGPDGFFNGVRQVRRLFLTGLLELQPDCFPACGDI